MIRPLRWQPLSGVCLNSILKLNHAGQKIYVENNVHA